MIWLEMNEVFCKWLDYVLAKNIDIKPLVEKDVVFQFLKREQRRFSLKCFLILNGIKKSAWIGEKRALRFLTLWKLVGKLSRYGHI